MLGLRRSEIFALTWDDVDLEKNTIGMATLCRTEIIGSVL
jgi:hypothetical protein